MAITFRAFVSRPVINYGKVTKALQAHMKKEFKEALRAFLKAAAPKIPVDTGAAKSTLLPLSRFVQERLDMTRMSTKQMRGGGFIDGTEALISNNKIFNQLTGGKDINISVNRGKMDRVIKRRFGAYGDYARRWNNRTEPEDIRSDKKARKAAADSTDFRIEQDGTNFSMKMGINLPHFAANDAWPNPSNYYEPWAAIYSGSEAFRKYMREHFKQNIPQIKKVFARAFDRYEGLKP